MKGMERRLGALEARAGNMDFAHLTDEQLQERLVGIWIGIAAHGLELPDGWEADCRADPLDFGRSMRPQVEALLCEI